MRASLADRGRGDELVRLVARVRRLGRRLATVGLVLALALHEQVDSLLRAVPACVAVHREVAADDAPDPPDARRLGPALDIRKALCPARRRGVAPVREGVDDEVLHPPLAASSISAFRWRSAECTPPSETSPMKCTRGAPRSASSSTSFSASDPSSMASSIRARSCLTIAPAPRLRWPTSELPICPSGSPTLGPHAVSVVWSCSSPEPVEHRRVSERDCVARPVRRQPPAVEDHQADGGPSSRRETGRPVREIGLARERVGVEAGAADERRRRCRGVRASPSALCRMPRMSRTLPMQASAGAIRSRRHAPSAYAPPEHCQQRPAARASRSLLGAATRRARLRSRLQPRAGGACLGAATRRARLRSRLQRPKVVR